MEKEKAKKMTIHDFEKEDKEKEMRRLIEKKRKEREAKENSANFSVAPDEPNAPQPVDRHASLLPQCDESGEVGA